MPVALRLALIARRQHGPIALEQLLKHLERWQVKYWTETKRLWRVYPTVYTLGYQDLDELGSWSAAVLACRPKAALACRSAGKFHHIRDRYDGEVEVTVGRPDRPHITGVRTRTTTWGPDEVVRRKNIWVTSLERTLLDLAAVLTFDELSDAFQKAMRLGLRMQRLEAVVARHPNAKGRRNLRKLIERHRDDNGFGAGGFENALYPWLKSWLPKRFKIQRNVKIRFDDGVTREADFLIGDVWIETDHYGHHAGAGPKKATEDLQRDRIVGKRFKLGRFTDWEFKHDRAAIKAHIEEMLGL